MKKLVVILAFVLLLPLFNSCSKNDKNLNESVITSELSTKDSLAFANLAIAINDYNNEFQIVPETKGRFWLKLLGFCTADLFGFMIGQVCPIGVVVGVMSSISSLFIDFTKAEDIILLNPNHNLYSSSLTLSSCDSIGILHNQIIYELYSEHPELFNSSTYSESQIYNLVLQKVSNYYNYPSISGLTYDSCHTQVDNVVSTVHGKDIETSFSEMSTLLPGKSNELAVIKSYCEAISTLDDDDCLKDYSAGFRQVILDSEIPTVSKELIQASVSVAGSSELLWAENE